MSLHGKNVRQRDEPYGLTHFNQLRMKIESRLNLVVESRL